MSSMRFLNRFLKLFFSQLSTNNVRDDASFPLIRWHQTGDFGYVPNSKMSNTFMAVAMDLGDFASPYGAIHPRYKQDVGHRLTLGALQIAYEKQVNSQGPYPMSAIRTGDGHVVVTYANEQQLIVKENGNFEVNVFSTPVVPKQGENLS